MNQNIYLFRRNGKTWADFTVPADVGKRGILRKFDLTNPQLVIDSPGHIIPERIRGLAERELSERAKAPAVEVSEIPEKLVKLTFWQRLVWLFTGRA